MILPSEPSAPERGWGPHQLRLHRQLLRRPELLPQGAGLLLAVSGGQDSMALTRLLRDLQPLHHWRLRLWHGDHGWRAESKAQARELKLWAESEGLELEIARAPERGLAGEAAARSWRYDCLARSAVLQGCTHVVTGHTASDRTETVLLNLARGCHLRGLASLRPLRPLMLAAPNGTPLLLSRPLLQLSRADTAQLCQERNLPVWLDTTNADPRFSRNRLRAEVLPVLEELHPGASRRISGLAERLAAESEQNEELLDLALDGLGVAEVPTVSIAALQRRLLGELSVAVQRQLLQHWLETHRGRGLASDSLEQLISRLAVGQGSGRMDLSAGWRLRWDGATLFLHSPEAPHG
ncbi:MAG: tRNA lysidine(34) synthetase TilS [Cyanobacteriota bacterium]